MLRAEDFFDLGQTRFAGIFKGEEYVWGALKNIKRYIAETIFPNVSCLLKEGPMISKTVVLHEGKAIFGGFTVETGDASKGGLVVKVDNETLEGASVIYAGVFLMDDRIEIGRSTVIEPGALIKGPAVIGDKTEVRQGAYIRGNVLVGAGCVVGHTTEMKSSVMLGDSKAGHFAYIGDSILGKVNLGAGTKLANLKIVSTEVIVKADGKKYETGLRKFGAILGDGVETGCNTVTTPGTLLSKGVLVYPNSTVSGYYRPGGIVKLRQKHELQKKDD
ncbi:MAG: glucose-1-phosphate thymidylyltransferase [Candidatus Omnitrophota bacterium]